MKTRNEKAHRLLNELRENLINDGLNFEDTSVGIYATTDLEDWAKNELPDLEGVELVSVTSEKAIILCEGISFEISLVVIKSENDVVEDSYWTIDFHQEQEA